MLFLKKITGDDAKKDKKNCLEYKFQQKILHFTKSNISIYEKKR